MSRQAMILANCGAFAIDKTTVHRISVSLPHDVVTAIQETLPAAGALSWCLQHAAQNLYDWIRQQPPNDPTTHRRAIDAVANGTAFQRSTVAVTPSTDSSPNEQRGVASVRGRTATPSNTSRPKGGSGSRRRTKGGKATTIGNDSSS